MQNFLLTTSTVVVTKNLSRNAKTKKDKTIGGVFVKMNLEKRRKNFFEIFLAGGELSKRHEAADFRERLVSILSRTQKSNYGWTFLVELPLLIPKQCSYFSNNACR